MLELLKTILNTAFTDIDALLIAAGIVLTLYSVGLFRLWLPSSSPITNAISVAVGLAFIVFGIWDIRTKKDKLPDPDKYKLRILSPSENTPVDNFNVSGTYGKKPPSGYTFWLATTFPARADDLRAVREILTRDDGSWLVEGCPAANMTIGGSSGERIILQAYLAGPVATPLFRYFVEAVEVHHIHGRVSGFKPLPGLQGRASDLVKCHEVYLRRK